MHPGFANTTFTNFDIKVEGSVLSAGTGGGIHIFGTDLSNATFVNVTFEIDNGVEVFIYIGIFLLSLSFLNSNCFLSKGEGDRRDIWCVSQQQFV